MMKPPAVLEIKNLSVTYRTDLGTIKAVNNVSLSIGPAEAVGLVGESGSGKSTVAAAILGLLDENAKIQTGQIDFAGQDLASLPRSQHRALLGNRIGAVFQDPFTSLNPSLLLGHQIVESLIQHRQIAKVEALTYARRLLVELGVKQADSVINSYPHQLSGGLRQRALIASAIICKPMLLILDEPTTALDVTVAAQILDLLIQLKQREDLSLLLISHNLNVVRQLCDKVSVIYAGEIVEQAQTQQLFREPRHPYTAGLISAIPQLRVNDRVRQLSLVPGLFPSLADLPNGCVFHSRCKYAEAMCKTQLQVLEPSVAPNLVRCWKSRSIFESFLNLSPDVQKNYSSSNTIHKPLINVDSVRKTFRIGKALSASSENKLSHLSPIKQVPAIDDVSLEISQGEVLGLVGESGSGKSTLGRLIIRLMQPDKGVISFDGQSIANVPEKHLGHLRKFAQIVFQNPDSSLNPRHTVSQILGRSITLLAPDSRNSLQNRIDDLLEKVQLSPSYAHRYPFQMSGGERQRVGIARALASNPKFIVCDEPTSSLDVSVQASILNLLINLRHQLGISYLFITHDVAAVSHIADRIAVMFQGKICEIGTVDEILNSPTHPYTQTLLSSVRKFAEVPLIEGLESAGEKSLLPAHSGTASNSSATGMVALTDTHFVNIQGCRMSSNRLAESVVAIDRE